VGVGKAGAVSLLIVCPVILPPRAAVLDSWTHRPHLCVINGNHDWWERVCLERGLDFIRSEGNAGCPASWNRGFEHARAQGHEYVAILSQSLVLGSGPLEVGGTSLLAACVRSFGDERGLVTPWSFHAIVFSVALWERVGPFDEGLPIYCDTDFVRRLFVAGERTAANPMPEVLHLPCQSVRGATFAAGLVPSDAYELDRRRYIAKWGHEPIDPCNPPRPATFKEAFGYA
jgi:hypothetical protein